MPVSASYSTESNTYAPTAVVIGASELCAARAPACREAAQRLEDEAARYAHAARVLTGD
jgi:hypothetical protein